MQKYILHMTPHKVSYIKALINHYNVFIFSLYLIFKSATKSKASKNFIFIYKTQL